jgi:protein-tyrosine phosphatase
MIDIHTHILPEIDDGPDDWQGALALLKQGTEDGIRQAVCTSHVIHRLDAATEQQFTAAFNELKNRARQAGIQISLWLGSEIHCQSHYSLSSPIATLNNNGKYLLFELPLGNYPANIKDQIFQMGLNKITPILAHPERNVYLMRHPDTVYELVNRGVLMQLNAGSILGIFGKAVKKAAEIMLDHQLIHFVGSDCHHVRTRPMSLSRAYQAIFKRWGEETAQNLFQRYPDKAIQGKPIEPPPVIPLAMKRKKWLFF